MIDNYVIGDIQKQLSSNISSDKKSQAHRLQTFDTVLTPYWGRETQHTRVHSKQKDLFHGIEKIKQDMKDDTTHSESGDTYLNDY